MKLLGLDTSTELCSVALFIEEKLYHEEQIAHQDHTQLILPMIDRLLKRAEMTLDKLDALTFGAGPGSFTGLRIAAGVIQGLAFAHNLPVIPISTLAVLAQGAHRQFKSTHILTALDARMHQIYWGIYQVDHHLVHPLFPDVVVDPHQAICPEQDDWIGVGLGWVPYQTILQKSIGERLLNVFPEHYPEAQDLIPLAQEYLRQGKQVPAEQALPLYLRDKVV